MSTYAQDFMDNKAIDTNASSLPDFPGRMLAYNNTTGSLGIFIPGEFDNAEPIDSIKFAMGFIMKRLKYVDDSNEKTTSTYVVGGEKTPYKLNYNGQTYTANSKKDMVSAMGLKDGGQIKQETIYTGFAIQINGTNLPSAEPIWYVSRGVNDYRLNDEIHASVGKLNKRTLIKLIADKEPYKNTNGGTQLVMNFEVEEVTQDKAQGFIDYITAQDADMTLAVYKQEMIVATESSESPQQTTNTAGMPSDPWGAPNNEIEISDDDLPF